MAARLTPDQKVGSLNLSALIAKPLWFQHKAQRLAQQTQINIALFLHHNTVAILAQGGCCSHAGLYFVGATLLLLARQSTGWSTPFSKIRGQLLFDSLQAPPAVHHKSPDSCQHPHHLVLGVQPNAMFQNFSQNLCCCVRCAGGGNMDRDAQTQSCCPQHL